MNQVNRQKVLSYCAECDTYPLYFNGYVSSKDEFDPAKFSVEDMIRRVLILSRTYASYNSNTEEFEASKDRWRSVLDIWRHIIYYYPTIEIFDVMRTMYEMQYYLGGQFCLDIQRRTFKLQEAGDGSHCMYMPPKAMSEYADRTTDEFELVWNDWKDI
jgi:hypothetical protein